MLPEEDTLHALHLPGREGGTKEVDLSTCARGRMGQDGLVTVLGDGHWDERGCR